MPFISFIFHIWTLLSIPWFPSPPTPSPWAWITKEKVREMPDLLEFVWCLVSDTCVGIFELPIEAIFGLPVLENWYASDFPVTWEGGAFGSHYDSFASKFILLIICHFMPLFGTLQPVACTAEIRLWIHKNPVHDANRKHLNIIEHLAVVILLWIQLLEKEVAKLAFFSSFLS